MGEIKETGSIKMRIVKNLTFQVIVAIICGIAVGAIWPSVGQEMKPIGETFINMIKMVIAPIIFNNCTRYCKYGKHEKGRSCWWEGTIIF